MKWLASVRAVLAGNSSSAPVTPAASPNLPSKAELRAKQVSCDLISQKEMTQFTLKGQSEKV